MMLSMLMSVLGVAGALYCMIISAVGLQDGPLCDTGDGIFIYPFLNSTTEESYLSNQTSWAVCVRPKNVVMWNVVLFSILLSIGTLEAVLLLAQIVNGLIGCLCGTCMNENLVWEVPDVVLRSVPLHLINMLWQGCKSGEQCQRQTIFLV
uniref:Uncharacterized protein n=1 Tax=Cyprinus carpio TaxID=7962 RepID=A0A8C2FJR5_CYPCA